MAQQKYYYILVNKNFNPIAVSEQLPIYWNKKVADDVAQHNKGCKVLRIQSSELQKAITLCVQTN